MTDWSEWHVEIQPLSNRLYEAMSLREYEEAERLAKRLADIAFDIQREAIRRSVSSGVGFLTNRSKEQV
jgi:hypothetical protein